MSKTPLTVYHDGSCPLCRLEIGHYSKQDGADDIDFVDVSAASNDLGRDLTRSKAMTRFHVRTSTGELLSGAAAFAAIWERLPRWGWAARVARLPGAMALMELGYTLFLPLRPILAKVAGRITRG